MKQKIIVEIICLLFVLLFMYAAVSKLIDIEKFQVQISQSPLLSKIKWLVAWSIPGIEIILSAMLISPHWRMLGLYGAFSLMVMFTAYIIAILNISENIPCSCGGILQAMGWKAHLIFNMSFVIVALTGILLHAKEATQQKVTS